MKSAEDVVAELTEKFEQGRCVSCDRQMNGVIPGEDPDEEMCVINGWTYLVIPATQEPIIWICDQCEHKFSKGKS